MSIRFTGNVTEQEVTDLKSLARLAAESCALPLTPVVGPVATVVIAREATMVSNVIIDKIFPNNVRLILRTYWEDSE